MLITSRSAAEYRAMFDLTAGELAAGSVLDCCAGGSSLTAETAGRVLAVDPAYALGPRRLAARVLAALADGDRIISAHADRFEWSWYGDPGRRHAIRTAAARAFLTDLRRRPGRYVAGALPRLPLADASVDLVLCSHLLFTWSDRFGLDWHRRALAELIRVARHEVRLFPLVVQGTGETVPFLETLRAELHGLGHRTRLCPVPYRFQRGADEMLLVERAPSQ
ncbi:MAG TPA: methyltransferase domain-containing protein [Actinophytocola sp.]|uniref:methyltransferase domain-containing protein n=1 Tax=Actinophytocola sp. TaxID=1872138 RepID=UPI002DBE1FD1|nr:methyltransferase domain-containing protein [Actinophytocola sp.]HEU5473440.1 methyltransferase domain-containing protein [Actinophytocola sp.]